MIEPNFQSQQVLVKRSYRAAGETWFHMHTKGNVTSYNKQLNERG